MTAAHKWEQALAAWAIPTEILERAVDDPWRCPVGLFKRFETGGDLTPTQRVALEVLPPGGTVLDVGCGAGAVSMPLARKARLIVGVDENPRMLEAFAESAERAGVSAETIESRWPEGAVQAPLVDVVVCGHVFYNVPDLSEFASALTEHARSRVAVELTGRHPQVTNGYLWEHFHSVERPTGPTADDAIAVLEELGLDASVERWEQPPRWSLDHHRAELVRFLRRNLCLPPGDEPKVDAALEPERHSGPRLIATLWWPGSAA